MAIKVIQKRFLLLTQTIVCLGIVCVNAFTPSQLYSTKSLQLATFKKLEINDPASTLVDHKPLLGLHIAKKSLLQSTSSSSTPSRDNTANATDNSIPAISTDGLVGIAATPLSNLPLPPQLRDGPFRKYRDFFAYIKDPIKFVLKRREKLGSTIFMCYMFLKPTVVIGGREAVKAFVTNREAQAQVVNSALPEPFEILHTEYGALNMDSNKQMHKEARALFQQVLGGDALAFYAPLLEKEVEQFVEEKIYQRVLSQEKPNEPLYLVPLLIDFMLQTTSKIYSGQGLTSQQVQLFRDYNDGLLSISTKTKQWKKGKEALDKLLEVMGERVEAYGKSQGKVSSDNIGSLFMSKLFSMPGFKDNADRRRTGTVLMIWGAYVESAALMIDALSLFADNFKYSGRASIDAVRQEFEKHNNNSSLSSIEKWNAMPYTLGVLRESLRVMPPGGGGFRSSDQDFELLGYRIPAGTVVTMEPRIGNFDDKLYPEATIVEPERWMPKVSSGNEIAVDQSTSVATGQCPLRSTALNRGPGSWFPGGSGAHACPGIPLAELISKQFLVAISKRFESVSCYPGKGFNERKREIKYTEIPIKVPIDEFGMILRPRASVKA